MKCILSTTGKQLLEEVHVGQCGKHAASRTLVWKVFRSGFYWPTAKNDAAELVQRCEACQYLSKQQHLPAQQLQTIPVTWPFACWGLDMIGPFKKAQGGYTHVLVAIDKFTKWIEFKPIASLTSAKAVEFIQDIIFRFGVPNSIITDLGSNFTSSEFFDFYEQKSIQIKYASVAHPRANGQVERANGMILEAQESGSESCRMLFGARELNLVELCMEILLSSWSTIRKRCYLLISSLGHRG
jgi:transposase InsO family protein